ncbi:MAG TPA: threonine--tRNA ligase, partial [Steroidobacteraceae bacterium]|nr:threonine--tRNA ligase [Steroidobacteraceae bacterium]
AARIENGQGAVVIDLSRPLPGDCKVTPVSPDSPEGLDVIRHSTAHLMAQAVKRLFPEVQITIGPVIDNGFYYDFKRPEGFAPEDLVRIEEMMRKIVGEDLPVRREELPRAEAVKLFRDMGEHYKVEIIEGLPEATVSLYRQGEFVDLCRGPHVPSTGKLKAFKLMKVAGAYWRGDSRNEMLQRIYGTAWLNDKDLKEYLTRLEEAEKRDHRRIGKDLDLFHFQEEAPGAVFWHPKGWRIFQQLIGYMRKRQDEAGYGEVNAPEIMESSLWQRSGHLEKFGENMFLTKTPDERVFAIKPMNCPGHIQIFNQGIRSYKDLPIRFAEFGKVHRYEPSGALHGLMRVRAFNQDDAHIFITEDQITEESVKVIKLLLSIYADFGFHDVAVKFADRPPKRVGSDEIWDKSEKALKAAAAAAGIECDYNPGEGAFYGPKLEFHLKDAIGRTWQCGTLQVDLNLPGRLGATYIDEHSQRQTPVMLHRAIFGSLERFFGILLEHHAGKLPAWLAPTQAVVMNITDRQDDYVQRVAETLRNQGIRAEIDLRNEKVGFKIRAHTLQRVPYLLVAGDKEVAANLLSVRSLSGKDLGTMSPEDFVSRLRAEVESHGRTLLEG